LFVTAAATLSAAAGCDADFSGFEDLFDPGPTYVNLPGRRVAEGRYSSPNVVGPRSGQAYVSAFVMDGSGDLLLQNLEGKDSCRVGPAGSYQIATGAPGAVGFIVPYRDVANGYGRVSIIDQHCRPLIDPVEDASLPLSPPFAIGDPPVLLIRTIEGDLLAVDPFSGTTELVTTDLAQIGFSEGPDLVWTREAGQVVVRDTELREEFRFGEDVTELKLWGRAEVRAAYVQKGTLYVAKSDGSKPVAVANDTCAPEFPAGWNGFGLSFFSPCEKRTLVLFELFDRRNRSDEPRRYVLGGPAAERTEGNPSITLGDETYVFFVTNEDPDALLGTLHGGVLGGPYETIGERSNLQVQSRGNGSFRTIVDRGDLGGRLVDWRPGQPVSVQAENVRTFNAQFALAAFDGTTGEAIALDETASYTIAKGVPVNGYRAGVAGQAILSDFRDDVGTLLAATETGAYETIAERVGIGGFSFIETLGAVAYLRDHEQRDGVGTGILGIRVLESADTFEAGTRADSMREVIWPRTALLYTVPEGPSRGIWYAEIR
jgi:hypothetical protein